MSAVLADSFRGNDQDNEDANFAELLAEVKALRSEVAVLKADGPGDTPQSDG